MVHKVSKELKKRTGIKVKGYGNLYRNVIPKYFKWTGKALSAVDYAFIINDIADRSELCASDLLGIGITTVGVLSPYGWIICGVYMGSDLIIKSVTGKDIGDYFNDLMDDEFGLDDGVLKKW